MKKVLLASAAVVASAGIATADVSFSGLGTLGIISNEFATGDDEFVIDHNVDLFIEMTGETDTGLSFGAEFSLEDLEDSTSKTNGYSEKTGTNVSSGSRVFLSGAFGTLTYGNTDGAFDRSTTEVYRIVGLDYELWGGDTVDNVDDENVLRYEYSFGDIRIAASYAGENDRAGVGVSGSADLGGTTLNYGVAYESGDDITLVGGSLGASFGDFGVRMAYWEAEDEGGAGGFDAEQLDVGVQYSAGAITVFANYRMDEENSEDDYTVGAVYDLGGGASVFAQSGTRQEEQITSLGVSFDF